MQLEELQSYDEVIEYLDHKKRCPHLLLGNGFSMAFDAKIFSYNALARFVDDLDNRLLKDLFEAINDKNFELVMRQLDTFAQVAAIFGADEGLIERIHEASNSLKRSLIDAVKSLHPEHVFKVAEEKSAACASFISHFLDKNGKVFTTNYDLLLYWVLMRNGLDSNDGFGRELLNPGQWDDEPDWSELRWGINSDGQKIYYLHGALHLFDTGPEIEKEVYENGHNLLDRIKERIDEEDYPIFVTAGTAEQKLDHIRHNRYLSFCYDALETIEGSLIVFGFGFGEYDTHIIDAINVAAHHGAKDADKLWSVYIGVYSQGGLDRLRAIESQFQCKVNYFNASTANVWA